MLDASRVSSRVYEVYEVEIPNLETEVNRLKISVRIVFFVSFNFMLLF